MLVDRFQEKSIHICIFLPFSYTNERVPYMLYDDDWFPLAAFVSFSMIYDSDSALQNPLWRSYYALNTSDSLFVSLAFASFIVFVFWYCFVFLPFLSIFQAEAAYYLVYYSELVVLPMCVTTFTHTHTQEATNTRNIHEEGTSPHSIAFLL